MRPSVPGEQEERNESDQRSELVPVSDTIEGGSLSTEMSAAWTSGVMELRAQGRQTELADPDDAGPQILVAQTESRLRRLIVKELEDSRVLLARNGDEVLEMATGMDLDAIVLDVDLPPYGGIEVCRRMRRLKTLEDVPIAITTVRTNEASMSDAMEAGAHEFLFKPFSRTELKIRIRNMVLTHQYLRELERKNRTLNAALEDLCESEAMLVQAEKLSVLGEMSAGIVHEINNPLTYCKTASFLLRELIPEVNGENREDFADLVTDINEGLDRVTHIVKDLRSFASKGTNTTTELNLSALVRTARRLLGNRLSNIGYVEEVPPHLTIVGNENQLCQVVLNMIKNGVEATEMAGRRISEAEIRIEGVETGEAVELVIRDNGCGISKEDQKRIFEPFFTRKERGKGMGLGLSICSRILADHNAGLRVASQPGQFTEFTLSFPTEALADRPTALLAAVGT